MKDRVLGEVIGHYPQLGKFSSWVKQEGWLYLVSGLAIVGLGGFILKSDDEEDEDALALQGATSGENGEAYNNENNAENNIENNIENPAELTSDNNSDID